MGKLLDKENIVPRDYSRKGGLPMQDMYFVIPGNAPVIFQDEDGNEIYRSAVFRPHDCHTNHLSSNLEWTQLSQVEEVAGESIFSKTSLEMNSAGKTDGCSLEAIPILNVPIELETSATRIHRRIRDLPEGPGVTRLLSLPLPLPGRYRPRWFI